MEGQQKKRADLKVVLLGESAVGKTTLVHRYVTGSFQENMPTIGASFFLRQWGQFNIALWDTAGEEKFSGLSAFYCRSAGAAVLAFDPCRPDTFHKLRDRHLPMLGSADPGCVAVIVATKLDLTTPDNRRVSFKEGYELAEHCNPPEVVAKSGVPYFETSSKSGANVEKVFEFIFNHCLGKPDPRYVARTRPTAAPRSDCVTLHDDTNQPREERRRSCCGK